MIYLKLFNSVTIAFLLSNPCFAVDESDDDSDFSIGRSLLTSANGSRVGEKRKQVEGSSYVKSSSASIPVKNQSELVEDLNIQLSKLIAAIVGGCDKDKEDEFYHMLIRYLQQKESDIKNDSEYDTIVIGGGISGTAAALAVGPEHRVLVLDKNEEWPSIFGNAGSFFLNNQPFYPLKGSPLNSVTATMQNGSPLKKNPSPEGMIPTISAAAVGKTVLIDLFYSGADVLMNSTVTGVRSIGTPVARIYEVTSGSKRFRSPHVIFATGWGGVNTKSFDSVTSGLLQLEMANSQGTVQDVETFLMRAKGDPHYANRFVQKKVAVIGGGDGGAVTVMGLLGYSPGVVNDSFSAVNRTTSLKADPSQLPFLIDWIGRKEIVPTRRKRVPEAVLEDIASALNTSERKILTHHSQKAENVTKNEAGQFVINLQGAAPLLVDEIIVATGYSQYLNDIVSDSEIRRRLVCNSKALFPSKFEESKLMQEYQGEPCPLGHSLENTGTDIAVVGAAAFENFTKTQMPLNIIDVHDHEGNQVGRKIKLDLISVDRRLPDLHRKQAGIEDRLSLLQLMNKD